MTQEQRQLFNQTLERLAWKSVLEFGMERWTDIQYMLTYVGIGMLYAWRVDVGPNTILTDTIEDIRNRVKLVGNKGNA